MIGCCVGEGECTVERHKSCCGVDRWDGGGDEGVGVELTVDGDEGLGGGGGGIGGVAGIGIDHVEEVGAYGDAEALRALARCCAAESDGTVVVQNVNSPRTKSR